MRTPRFVYVVGGVLSGLGKGVVTASIGNLLKACGYKVTAIKVDPYVNVDAGTMRPTEHGKIFVTEDGGEIDQDLGTYERFLNQNLSKKNNITTGKVFLSVIQKERALEYKGKNVQLIPDVSDEVKKMILEVAKGFDITLVEIVKVKMFNSYQMFQMRLKK
jgi:CTP synthase